MSKIVVTYFEPFGGRSSNASKEVVSLLNCFETKELPVSWNKIQECLDEILSSHPNYLFLVGEAHSYKEITVERTTHNISFGKDNEDVYRDNEPIIVGDKEEKTTIFDLSDMPYHISDNAGKYLCNYTYYLALSKAKDCKVLFIHLPYIEESGPNSLDNLKNALLNIIDILSR